LHAILAAIISGIFGLAAVVLDNRLKQGNQPRGFPTSAEWSASLSDQKRAGLRRIVLGVGLLLIDFIFVCVVVSAFNLDRVEPWWESLFTILVVGILPLIALGLMFWGIINFVRS